MVRLSSKDVSLLIKVLVAEDRPRQERLKLVEGAGTEVREIARALIDGTTPANEEIKEAVEAVREWAAETKRITESRFAHYA